MWNYYRDEVNDVNENNAARVKLNNNKTITDKSFEYKTKLMLTMGQSTKFSHRVNLA